MIVFNISTEGDEDLASSAVETILRHSDWMLHLMVLGEVTVDNEPSCTTVSLKQRSAEAVVTITPSDVPFIPDSAKKAMYLLGGDACYFVEAKVMGTVEFKVAVLRYSGDEDKVNAILAYLLRDAGQYDHLFEHAESQMSIGLDDDLGSGEVKVSVELRTEPPKGITALTYDNNGAKLYIELIED